MIIEDQGYGIYVWAKEFAKEQLKQDKTKESKKALDTIIIHYAEDNAESYTPSPELGKNPEGRISIKLRPKVIPWLYKKDSPFLKKVKSEGGSTGAAQLEISSGITKLTQYILKHNFGFKTRRKPGATLSDPKQITDFEYLATGPGNTKDKEERELYNKAIDMHRHIRIMIENYIAWAIAPVMSLSTDDIYDVMMELGYKELEPSTLRKKGYMDRYLFLTNKLFATAFMQVKFKDFFKGYKWRSGKQAGFIKIKGKSSKS